VTVHATPVLTHGFVVIADDQGRVVALNPADGSVQWTKELASPVYTSIAAAEGTLYVPSTRGRFFALDAAQGDVRWQVTLPDTTVRFTAPAVDGSLVVVGASDGALRAFDASTGAQQWLFQDAAALTATPLLTPNTVYIGNMGHSLFAVNRQTGRLRWKGDLKGRVKSALAARDGYLVVLSEPRFVYLFQSASVSSDVASP
jgi:outer membrane protein assembly factor BamB